MPRLSWHCGVKSHEQGRRPKSAATDRLIKLLGLLGSEHAGERAAAAAAAEKLLRQHGLTSREWVDRRQGGGHDRHGQQEHSLKETKETIDFCLAHRPALNDWELNFLLDISKKFALGLSPKQRAKVQDIRAKVAAYANDLDVSSSA